MTLSGCHPMPHSILLSRRIVPIWPFEAGVFAMARKPLNVLSVAAG